MTKKKFRTMGLVVRNDQIVPGELELTYPDRDQAGGIGEFINNDAYLKMVEQTYSQEIERANNKQPTSPDHVVFHIGKTVLQLILAQPGSEGIRITKISYNDRDTFVIEALSGDQAFTTSDGKIFNKSLKKVNGDDPSRSEDIYGFTFGDLYEHIKNQISPTKPLTTKDFIGII